MLEMSLGEVSLVLRSLNAVYDHQPDLGLMQEDMNKI